MMRGDEVCLPTRFPLLEHYADYIPLGENFGLHNEEVSPSDCVIIYDDFLSSGVFISWFDLW